MFAGVAAVQMQIVDGKFRDDRWENGRWIMSKFTGRDGEVDWDRVRMGPRLCPPLPLGPSPQPSLWVQCWAGGCWTTAQGAGQGRTARNAPWLVVCATPEVACESRLVHELECACFPQVIDAEIARRKLLEDVPIPSTNEEPVLFDTAEIPWWAWVKRFHLPEVSLGRDRVLRMPASCVCSVHAFGCVQATRVGLR